MTYWFALYIDREKLDSWLKARGKTPSRFPHLMCLKDRIVGDREHAVEDTTVEGGLSVEELNLQVRWSSRALSCIEH